MPTLFPHTPFPLQNPLKLTVAFFSTISNNCNPTLSQSSSTMSNSDLNPDSTSYLSFDSSLQDGTTRVITTLAAAVEVRSLSLNPLRQLTGSLLDIKQDVVTVILNCRKDIWDDHQLFLLVKDYFELTLQTLDFCTSLNNCLKEFRSTLSVFELAIDRYNAGTNHLTTIEQFKEFKELDRPFTNEFFGRFESVNNKQITLLKSLRGQRGKVDKKLKSTENWRKLSIMVFAIAFIAGFFWLVMVTSISAPPLVMALMPLLILTVAAQLGWSMGKWVNSLWDKYEKVFRDQMEIIIAMDVGSNVAIKYLDKVKVHVDKLGEYMETMLKNVDFAINDKGQEAMGMVVDEMKSTMNVFAKTIGDLSEHSEHPGVSDSFFCLEMARNGGMQFKMEPFEMADDDWYIIEHMDVFNGLVNQLE
ncbi:UPF0496 protein At2g18630-like [Rutidosis leptorrhynchoides]|uniref:UPF0496 protein At2g18630-like n=1 Tax=Rutidosis leptorrhynchoides TaxID=125765 RepID=UPI003A99C358